MESKNDYENQLIRAFKNTYNADYIRELSDEKKLYAINDNPVLQRLVNNLRSPPIKPPYIEGPYTFYRIVSDFAGRGFMKTFYLFGEKHLDTRGHCPRIEPGFPQPIEFHNYIESLSRNTYSFTDLYVELSMLNPTKPLNKDELTHYDINLGRQTTSYAIQSTIENMFVDNSIDFQSELENKIREPTNQRAGYILESLLFKYRECIQPSTRTETEKCQLMRIHNIDSRSNWGTIAPSYLQFYIDVLLTVLLKTDKTTTEKMRILKRIGEPIQKVLEILASPEDTILDSIINLFKTNPSIKKEIDERTYLKDEIEAFIRHKIAVLIHSEFSEMQRIAYFTIILRFLQNDERYSLNEEYKIILDLSLNKIPLFLGKLDGLAMDMYALSRIFKVYKKSPNQPSESINIIVYAGNNHIQTYREFLKTFGDPTDEKYYYENPHSSSCVRMKW